MRRFQHRWWLHLLLFALTVATTTDVGVSYYASFISGLGTRTVAFNWTLIAHGVIYSAAILGILGAHEMGHYLACRYYDLDATLPFFLPFPLLSISGTLGAVIKIREPFPTRRALFDVGVAGPLAGFAVLVPLLFYSVSRSNLVASGPMPPGTINFGEPLLFQLVAWLKFGTVGSNVQLNLHPIGFAAWFGMLATAWNLLPFGQLDGGHLTHAAMGPRSRYVSYVTLAGSVVMCFFSLAWLVTTLSMMAMMYFVGPRHPPVLDDSEPLGAARLGVAFVAAVVFVLCFIPVPIEVVN